MAIAAALRNTRIKYFSEKINRKFLAVGKLANKLRKCFVRGQVVFFSFLGLLLTETSSTNAIYHG